MRTEDQTVTIGRLARAAAVGVETIRFYEREGLLDEPARTASGYRQYPPETAERLAFIRRAKALTEHKLAEIERRIDELRRMRAALADLDRQCSGHGPVEGCPIIETLSGAHDHE